MWVLSRVESFPEILGRHMKERNLNHRALAKRANMLGGDLPGWVHLGHETVRSWLRNKVRTPRKWQQLAAVAQALNLREHEAEELFQSTGAQWTIRQLLDLATEPERALLEFPKYEIDPLRATIETLPSRASDSSHDLVPSHRGTMEPAGSDRKRALAPSAIVLIFTVVVVGIGLAGILVWSSSGEISEPLDGSDSTPIAQEPPIGPSCSIDLSVLPYGPQFAVGEAPQNCGNLLIFNQYEPDHLTDLGPWDESILSCWVSPNLARLWIRFQLPEGQGWLDLDPSGETSNSGFDDIPQDQVFSLRSDPESTSPVVASLTYAELVGAADELRLDLPPTLDPDLADTEGDYHHLAGCWQESPTDDGLGLHFYWSGGL